MKQAELQQILTEFAAERLALLEHHEAAARVVSHYDFNNAYQYVINREETHLSWVTNALAEYAGAASPAVPAALPGPEAPKARKQVDASDYRPIVEDDARYLRAFVEKWRGRVDGMTNGRHRIMLNVILGESKEHERFFEQAAAGFEDLLGRRTTGAARVGGVLPTRWME